MNQLKKKLISFKEKNIECVESGEKCLEFIKTNTVDIIFMDEVMETNELLGSETVKKIRAQNYKMKIIHCSGNSCKEDIEKYLQAGSNNVVGKPLPIKELDNIVYNLLY